VALEVNDQRAIVVVASQREVVDTHDRRRGGWRQREASDQADEGASARRQEVAAGKAGTWAATHRDINIVEQRLQADRSPAVAPDQPTELLGECLA
jgi:hypothetical protein